MTHPALNLTTVAQWAGITMPTLYAGMTLQYSLTMSLLAHSHTSRSSPSSNPNSKLLAKQWLALYQQGPYWVPPLIHTGFLVDLYLAFHSSSFRLYLAAAALTISVLPITFFYLEPGINGACKWKVESLLRAEEEGLRMPESKGWIKASVVRHSANEASKRWADGADMSELVLVWARRNHGRWVLTVLAGVLSFAAMIRDG